MRCLLCQNDFWPLKMQRLCQDCLLELAPSPLEEPSGSCLYLYNEPMRKLIIDGKVAGNQRSVECLWELFIAHPKVIRSLEQVKLIIPAPSSLYSRLRGRIDLAWIFAKRLSLMYKIPFKSAPFALYLRLKKRSRLKDRKPILTLASKEKTSDFLIVDDVITSGYTLKLVADKLTLTNYRFLCLADSISAKIR